MEPGRRGQGRENRKTRPRAPRRGQGSGDLRQQTQTRDVHCWVRYKERRVSGGWVGRTGLREGSWKRWHVSQAPGEGPGPEQQI